MNREIKNHVIDGLAAIALCLSLGYAIAGQNALGVVGGSVVDPQGAVVPGAKVVLTREKNTDVVTKTTTDSDGKFKFSGVAPGEYEIEISVSFIERAFRKQITVKPAQQSQSDFILNLEPCFGETESGKQIPLTDDDRAAITREIINLKFPMLSSRAERNLPKIIFSDASIKSTWLNPEQRESISVLSRRKIQDITEQTDGFTYYSLSKMTTHGSCLDVSLLENVTVKGQIEDANMAGGGTLYEFKKVNGKWTGKAFSSWIS
jgi:hypothetical protein